jgi:hypothetical protein
LTRLSRTCGIDKAIPRFEGRGEFNDASQINSRLTIDDSRPDSYRETIHNQPAGRQVHAPKFRDGAGLSTNTSSLAIIRINELILPFNIQGDSD